MRFDWAFLTGEDRIPNRVALDQPIEAKLEQLIFEDPEILSDEWLLISKQVPTALGERVDVLAVDRSGFLIMIELMKDMKPRDVIAQALEFDSWIQRLESEHTAAIYAGSPSTKIVSTSRSDRDFIRMHWRI